MSAAESDTLADEALELSKAIAPMLAGRAPDVQSAALADLTSIWLAGHVAHDDGEAETERLREKLLAGHVALVRSLVEVNFKLAMLGAANRQ